MEYCNEQLLCVLNTSAERKLKKYLYLKIEIPI